MNFMVCREGSLGQRGFGVKWYGEKMRFFAQKNREKDGAKMAKTLGILGIPVVWA